MKSGLGGSHQKTKTTFSHQLFEGKNIVQKRKNQNHVLTRLPGDLNISRTQKYLSRLEVGLKKGIMRVVVDT